MYWYCYFEHYEKPGYNHHLVVKANNETQARIKAVKLFEDNFQLDAKQYMLEEFNIDGEFFIFD